MGDFTTGCRLCGLRIRMITTAASRGKKRKWMPIDIEPAPGGTIAIDPYGDAAVVPAGQPLHDGELYHPHHYTCEAYKAGARPPERKDIDG